ncbi:MAG: glycosyltransferase family 4 protein [Pseudomonadota bacterium]
MPVGLYHHPDAVHRPGADIMGRRAAGSNMLAALARETLTAPVHCVVDDPSHAEDFCHLVESLAPGRQTKSHLMAAPETLGELDAIMLPGPGIAEMAWQRARRSRTAYSLCGITHTLATRRIAHALFDLYLAPVTAWDAVICTSRAARQVVENHFDAAHDYLARERGATARPHLELPVLPLGLDADALVPSPGLREIWRRRLNIEDGERVVMTLGRLSTLEKLQPAPLMMALELAAEATEAEIRLVATGWFDSPESENMYRRAADRLAPSVATTFIDGTDPEAVLGVRAAADLFVMPVDNIQETFGLAILEAMAAGLPVVCSDWDGHRDTVVDGVTGITVPTLMAAPGGGAEIAERHDDGTDTYLQFLGQVQQRTAIDVRALAAALAALIAEPEKARALGSAGQQRASTEFDWSVLLPRYRALWAELAARRRREGSVISTACHPAVLDPFANYGHYATAHLKPDTLLDVERAVDADRIADLMHLTGDDQVGFSIAPPDLLAEVQTELVKSGPLPLLHLGKRLDMPADLLERCILWLVKYDLVQVDRRGTGGI